MVQEHAFCLAIEKLANITVPPRASIIRVLFSEITRVLNHLLNQAHLIMDAGATTPMLWCYEQRDKLLEFYERASGARLHANYIRPGGVHQDLPAGLADDIAAYCDHFDSFMKDLESLVTGNRIFRQRAVQVPFEHPPDFGDLVPDQGQLLETFRRRWDFQFTAVRLFRKLASKLCCARYCSCDGPQCQN